MKCPESQAAVSDDSRFCSKCRAALAVDLGSLSPTRTILGPVLHLKKGQMIGGKYQIIQKIGVGGMGIVYKAQDTRLKRNVALKFLPSELTRNKKAKARFIQEAQGFISISFSAGLAEWFLDHSFWRLFACEIIECDTQGCPIEFNIVEGGGKRADKP